MNLDHVRTLLVAVDEGTFDAAASALHITPSAVSQRVKALEQRTGRVLLTRSKPVRPTESGEVLIRLARQLTRLEEDATRELGIADEPNRLPIAVNADSLATWFLPALTDVPPDLHITYELHREDESRTTELLRQGLVMAAVTNSPDPVQGCSVRHLGHMRYLSAASPAFVRRWLHGREEALRTAPVIVFDRSDDIQDRFVRRTTGHNASDTRHFVPSSEGYTQAIVAGMGWGMVPEAQAAPYRADNRLVVLDPGNPVDVPLHWQQWKLDSPALSATAEAVTRAAHSALRLTEYVNRSPR